MACPHVCIESRLRAWKFFLTTFQCSSQVSIYSYSLVCLARSARIQSALAKTAPGRRRSQAMAACISCPFIKCSMRHAALQCSSCAQPQSRVARGCMAKHKGCWTPAPFCPPTPKPWEERWSDEFGIPELVSLHGKSQGHPDFLQRAVAEKSSDTTQSNTPLSSGRK